VTKRRNKKGKWLVILLLAAITLAGIYLYQRFFRGIHLRDKTYTYLFISSNDTYDDLVKKMGDEGIISDESAFRWMAGEMNLDKNMHPGRFRIINGMTMRQIINLVKYGRDEKVKLSINSQIHNLEEFVEYLDDKLDLSDDEIEAFIYSEEELKKNFGLDPASAFALVVPGTYDVNWAVSVKDLFATIRGRYNKIWSKERRQKANAMGFTIPQVIVIASIVQCESHVPSEQQKIAGVYINRLRKKMRLQADPTLKFAGGNYEVQRVLNDDKEVDSPYNTYMYKGLPPGPICPVTLQAIDATLNYRRHNFLYFCARPDLNGYSDFSSTYEEHSRYARAYQKNLDRMGIGR
jgi:UPF0755 protein